MISMAGYGHFRFRIFPRLFLNAKPIRLNRINTYP